jgi:hypothetical protein
MGGEGMPEVVEPEIAIVHFRSDPFGKNIPENIPTSE